MEAYFYRRLSCGFAIGNYSASYRWFVSAKAMKSYPKPYGPYSKLYNQEWVEALRLFAGVSLGL